ncbi:Allantoinase [Acidisarcina polymorpha]|uniref:allantoinase n=1 Tax=Acidisarcina polymorpha TaxID=2211140 RepID=A0A2Z5FY17_9BACT|nr:allantoinase AllB [Acidisarcina polymorpha]AXC11779.1 Allantoinase [Acidisarcina polymorpha]
MDRQAFLSSRVVLPEGIGPATVLVSGGHIESVTHGYAVPEGYTVQDFGADCLLPGLVDPHVHINEPGRAEWEGFATATRAAAAGGYTTLVDMPLNCLPETVTVEALEQKRAAAQGKCWVDWAPWGGIVRDNQQQIAPLAAAGVPGFKCFLIYPGIEGFTMVDENQLRAALPHVAGSGLPLLVHAELAAPLEEAEASLADADWTKYATYLASRPDEAEVSAIRLLIDLCREFKTPIHIVHLSSAQALAILGDARSEGLPITVETCPHYLHFAAEQIPDGATLFKCAPPIRNKINQNCLWEALLSGVIDFVASDHSPCPLEMKRHDTGDFKQAWGGIAGLSLSLPVLWTELRLRGLPLTYVGRWMAEAPAKLAGLSGRKGKIAAGFDADLVVFDPEAAFTVTPERLHFRHSVSPYVGENLFGTVKATFLRGSRVFSNNAFADQPLGMELRH